MRKENITDIFRDAIDRTKRQVERVSSEAVASAEEIVKENMERLKEWEKNSRIPPDALDAYNKGIEDAAKLIEELGTNNLGMLHDINQREATAIRALKK